MEQPLEESKSKSELEQLIKYIQQEGKENSIIRRNSLKLIRDDVQTLTERILVEFEKKGKGVEDQGDGDAKENLEDIYVTLLPRPVSVCISDQLERSREFAYETLSILLTHMPNKQVVNLLPHLIPRLVERLGQQELIEVSEEVRLVAMNFLELLVGKMGAHLAVYIDDFLQILGNTILDDFYSVRIKSCKVVSDIAKSNGKVFHYNSERLIKPLCTSITHQRYPVRLACVNCIGDVIQFGNHKSIELVLPHLTQRLFDSAEEVRKAVIEVIGFWMKSYIDRYSFFPKFLPLLLTGLGDESPDVIFTAQELWSQAGLQYLEENIEEYKDEADFLTATPNHYPKDVQRPNLGCRILTHLHASKLIPGLGAEITDWVLSTRIKSSQLIYNLILNSEEKITMHAEPVLQCLFKGSQDEDSTVLNCVLKSAELVGYFVPLSVTWPIITSKISSVTNNDSGLAIAMSVLNGTESSVLEEHLSKVMDLIKDKDVCQTMKPKLQKRVLEISDILLTELRQEVISEVAVGLFATLLTILSVTKDIANSERAYDLLRKLERLLELNSFEELLGTYCGAVLEEMKQTTSDWTPLSADKQIFDLILSQGGLAVSNNMELILDIMITNLGPEKDAQVRIKVFTMLAKHLKTYGETTRSEQLQDFAKNIIEDILGPNLVWTAGKTACALRTVATCCLHAILEARILCPTVIVQLWPKLDATLMGLIEDTPELTRVLAAESIRLAIQNSDKNISPDHLHKLYGVLLKRLDDVSNTVRTSAACGIAAVFNNVPVDYDVKFFKVHLESVYSVLLVHLDDSEEAIQEVIFDTLREVGKLFPNCLIAECEKIKMKHRSSDLCEKLINIFQSESSETPSK